MAGGTTSAVTNGGPEGHLTDAHAITPHSTHPTATASGVGSLRDLDRLATSYYVDILESQRAIFGQRPDDAVRTRVEDLMATATRHKHEIDYTLRHWATPVERARIEDRLGSLMRIGMRLRELRESGFSHGRSPEPAPAA